MHFTKCFIPFLNLVQNFMSLNPINNDFTIRILFILVCCLFYGLYIILLFNSVSESLVQNLANCTKRYIEEQIVYNLFYFPFVEGLLYISSL